MEQATAAHATPIAVAVRSEGGLMLGLKSKLLHSCCGVSLCQTPFPIPPPHAIIRPAPHPRKARVMVSEKRRRRVHTLALAALLGPPVAGGIRAP